MPANGGRLELELTSVDDRTHPAQMHVAVAFRQLPVLWQHSCQGLHMRASNGLRESRLALPVPLVRRSHAEKACDIRGVAWSHRASSFGNYSPDSLCTQPVCGCSFPDSKPSKPSEPLQGAPYPSAMHDNSGHEPLPKVHGQKASGTLPNREA